MEEFSAFEGVLISSAAAYAGNHNDFLFKGKDGGLRCRPGLSVRNRGPHPPLVNGLLVDSMASRKGPQALLTMLYRSTHSLRRVGAPVENLSDTTTFWNSENYEEFISGTRDRATSTSRVTQERPISP